MKNTQHKRALANADGTGRWRTSTDGRVRFHGQSKRGQRSTAAVVASDLSLISKQIADVRELVLRGQHECRTPTQEAQWRADWRASLAHAARWLEDLADPPSHEATQLDNARFGRKSSAA